MSKHSIKEPSPSRQVAFHQLLVGARKTLLIDALSEALSRIDPAELKAQLIKYVPSDGQQILASAGVRDEHVFPTPIVLEAAPMLVGYYRLLLGVPQKTFYGTGSGMGQFKSMEVKGSINNRQKANLSAFCEAMSTALADLVRQLSPTITLRDIRELPLLTLGSQFQGGNNNTIGKQATVSVFLAIIDVVEPYIIKREDNKLIIKVPSNRTFIIKLASDPDVTIEEDPEQLHKLVAIEIKGGTDRSNAHNRAGEAEKSHLKARNQGFPAFWTVIHKKGLVMATLKDESPTTDLWFDIAQVIGRQGEDWDEFSNQIARMLDITREPL